VIHSPDVQYLEDPIVFTVRAKRSELPAVKTGDRYFTRAVPCKVYYTTKNVKKISTITDWKNNANAKRVILIGKRLDLYSRQNLNKKRGRELEAKEKGSFVWKKVLSETSAINLLEQYPVLYLRCVSLRKSKIRKRILRFFTRQINPRSLGSVCIKGTEESLPRVDCSVPLMHHNPGNLKTQNPFFHSRIQS